jgi:hypothetical protein
MEYIERRKLNEEKISYSFPMFFDRDFSDWRRIRRIYDSTLSTCFICENCESNDIENVQLFQFHIKRLENQLFCCCSQANTKKKMCHKNSNGSKRCNYTKSKNNKSNIKGKNFKNKLFYRHG